LKKLLAIQAFYNLKSYDFQLNSTTESESENYCDAENEFDKYCNIYFKTIYFYF